MRETGTVQWHCQNLQKGKGKEQKVNHIKVNGGRKTFSLEISQELALSGPVNFHFNWEIPFGEIGGLATTI
jgi:hypothetical protein